MDLRSSNVKVYVKLKPECEFVCLVDLTLVVDLSLLVC